MAPILIKALRLAALLPPALLVVLVYRYGVDLPLFDQWALVPVLERIQDGQLRGIDIPLDLFHGHNEHRLFFPRIWMLTLAAVSDWNIRLELFSSLLLAALVLWALARMAQSLDLSAGWRASLLFLLSFAVFNPMQWENWSWGWQIQIFLVVVGGAWAIHLLTYERAQEGARDKPGLSMVLALLAAFVATFSFANGLLVWPVGLVLLLLARPRDCTVRWHPWPVVWALAGSVAVTLFFAGYALPSYVDPPRDSRAILDWGLYVLLYVGSPIASWLGPPPVIGLVAGCGALGVAATLAVLALSVRSRLAPAAALPSAWRAGTGLGLWALGSATMTGWGRLALGGPEQALTSRYTTIASLLWIGLALCLLAITFPSNDPTQRDLVPGAARWAEHRFARRVVLAGAIGAGLVLLAGAREGWRHLHGQWRHREPVREAFRTGTVVEQQWEALGIERASAEPYLETLWRLRLSLYRDLDDPPPPTAASRTLQPGARGAEPAQDP